MITLKITNKTAYTLIVILAVLTTTLVVYAYQSGGPPSFVGHSAEEIEIEIDGQAIDLQTAIEEGSFGGGMSCEWKFAGDPPPTIQDMIDNGATGICYWEKDTDPDKVGVGFVRGGAGTGPRYEELSRCINSFDPGISAKKNFYYYACQ